MKFPIKSVRKSSSNPWVSFPDKSICPICNNSIIGDFVCLNVAAMSKTNAKIDCDLSIHMTAHFDSKKIYCSADVVDCEKTEQLDIYVCSIDCMRDFFMKSCDELEKKTFPDVFSDKQIDKIK